MGEERRRDTGVIGENGLSIVDIEIGGESTRS